MNNEKRAYIDPFQIFCAQQRDYMIKGYPHLNSSNITTLLARQWQNMSQKDREYYVNMSISIGEYDLKTGKQIKIVNAKKDLSESKNDGKNGTKIIDEESSPDPLGSSSDNETDFSIPKIFVVSRTGFGRDVEEASKSLLSKAIEEEKGL